MGTEFNYGDKVRLLNNLSELPELRREVGRLTSAVERQTREFEEQMLSVRCSLIGLIVVILLGILAFIITMAIR